MTALDLREWLGLDSRMRWLQPLASRMRWLPLALLLLGFAGCATSRPMRLPSKGGPPWIELQSEHFSLQTDLDEPSAREALVEFENRRSGLIAAAWHNAEFRGARTRVITFIDREELDEFLAPGILGFTVHGFRSEKFIVVPRRDGRILKKGLCLRRCDDPDVVGADFDPMRAFTHEIVHDLASAYFARQPRWLSEGLATFLDTMQLDLKAQRATVGLFDANRATATLYLQTPLSKLMRDEVLDEETSWAVVFYLVNREVKAFDEYQTALFRGDDPAEAWSKAFPRYASDEGLLGLQETIAKAMRGVTYKKVSAPLRLYSGPIAGRVMSEPEIRALRGRLFLLAPSMRGRAEREALAKAEADAALHEDPAQAEALELRVQLANDRTQKLSAARTAVDLHQDHAGVLMLVDAALGDEGVTPEEEKLRVSSLERAVALAPDNPRALQRLARAYAQSGQAARALPLVRRSLQLLPDNPAALDTFALVADAQGDCRAARELQRMAVERLPHPAGIPQGKGWTAVDRAWIAALRERLARLEARCPS
jgi:tetratricopeptide (TPR) repeat protein